jgi:hypothetical protein
MARTDYSLESHHGPGDLEDVEEPQVKLGRAETPQDTFGNEEFAEIKYKTLSWWQCGFGRSFSSCDWAAR